MKLEHVNPSEIEPSTEHLRPDTEPSPEMVTNVENVGIVEPPICRKEDAEIRVVDGLRRLRAASEAGIDEVSVLIRELSDTDALALGVLQNGASCLRKEVSDSDRERSLERISEISDESRGEIEVELGLWSEQERILEAYGNVHGVGEKTAERLADEFGSLEDVKDATAVEISNIDGIGIQTAEQIRRGYNEDTSQTINES